MTTDVYLKSLSNHTNTNIYILSHLHSAIHTHYIQFNELTYNIHMIIVGVFSLVISSVLVAVSKTQ